MVDGRGESFFPVDVLVVSGVGCVDFDILSKGGFGQFEVMCPSYLQIQQFILSVDRNILFSLLSNDMTMEVCSSKLSEGRGT